MTVKTDVLFFDKDVGKNLYRKKTYYTICIEQDVLAKDKDEADQKFLDGGGIDYDEMRTNLTTQNDGVETYSLDCNYTESGDTEYLGKVTAEYDEEYTDEVIDHFIDEDAEEISKVESPMTDFKEKVLMEN